MKKKILSIMLSALILISGICSAESTGEALTLLAAPAIIGDSTMVPVRFISEQLGMKVSWEDSTKLITITSK